MASNSSFAGFDFGEVQNVVEDGKQRLRRCLHGIQAFQLLRREIRVQHQFGHSQNAVHGGADLVAHVGQKFALGAAGFFRGFLSLLQLFLTCLRSVMSRRKRVKRYAFLQPGWR